jgi:CTP:molybdopterin cytidylyltransferase MocA
VATVNAIVAARGSRPIVATSSGGLVLPPVLLERSAFDSVALLDGDAGLREVIRGNPQLVREVPVGAIPADVDTPADLERLGSSGSV